MQSKKVYVGIKIDKEQTLSDLLTAHGKSLGFAQSIKYYCREIIGSLLAKANAEANSLDNLSPEEKEEKTAEKKDETQTKPEGEQ